MPKKKRSASTKRREDNDLVTMTVEVPRMFRAAVARAVAISTPATTQRAIVLNSVLAYNDTVRSEYAKLRLQVRKDRKKKGENND